MKQQRTWTALALLPLMALAGCNVFSIIDSPSGNAQILSAAHGAVDRGDFKEARKLYAKLASPNDQAKADSAFADLTDAGAGLGPFMEAFGDGGSAAGIAKLAGILAAKGANESQRKLLFAALEKVETINDSGSAQLRGLLRLMAASAIAAHCFAVDADISGDANTFEATDLMTTPSGCELTDCLTTAAAECGAPSGAKFTFASGQAAKNFSGVGADQIEDVDTSEEPDSTWLQGSINAINYAIQNELAAGGKFGTGLKDLVPANDNGVGTDACYRAALREAKVVQ